MRVHTIRIHPDCHVIQRYVVAAMENVPSISLILTQIMVYFDYSMATKWWNNRTKKSKLHIPHSTNNSFTATYGNPVSMFSMYIFKGTFSRIVYTTIWLMNTRALSGEEVTLMWKITPESTAQLLGTVPENSTRPIHSHGPNTYCIPECMSIVQCDSQVLHD